MILIIGGKAQGKTALAESLKKKNDLLFDNVNDWARKQFDAGRSFDEAYDNLNTLLTEQKTAEDSRLLLVTTEIGNGIVPMNPKERNFREWMGRLQIRMASEADTVIRVCCGLGQQIKG